jgi:hypothetical protein
MIIAFVGFKQVGKTTASQYLIEKYGFVKHSFKDALVAEIKEKFPDLLESILKTYEATGLEGVDYKTVDNLFIYKPPLMRALMQNYGTEVRRGDDPDYWVKEWAKNSYGHSEIVCDDVRFLNEADKVKQRGGIIIRLTRPDLPTGGDHKSETEQLQIEADYTIECEAGDYDHLYRELDKIVDNLKSQ